MLPKQPNKSLIDGIRCLQALVSKPGPVRISELSKELHLETTRVHRLLRTLGHMGFTRQNSSRKYIPGPAIYPLAAQSLYASHFMRDAIGPLTKLRRATSHIVACGVLWDRKVSYLYHAKKTTPLDKAIGTFGYWESTDSGIGMAILASMTDEEIEGIFGEDEIANYPGGLAELMDEIRKIRQQGYAFIKTESGSGNCTLALASEKKHYLGIGISGKLTEEELPDLLELLREARDDFDSRSE